MPPSGHGSLDTHQLQHVFVVEARVDTDLPVHLVVVELAELAAVVDLDGHLHARGFADGKVHSGRVAAPQLLGHDKLVDAPAA